MKRPIYIPSNQGELTAQPLWHDNNIIASLVPRLGNGLSFVSQILNSTMLVTPMIVVYIMKLVDCCVDLTTPLSYNTIRSWINIEG